MSVENAIETEVKISVPEWTRSAADSHFAKADLTVKVPRLFEANYVYDTPQQSIRSAQMLLRLRRVGDKNVLTWKGPAQAGPHKSRPELEVLFDSFETMHQILKNLGYGTYFQYEKYRTEYAAVDGGTATFDETPIGNFIELEGAGPWIDATAVRLGFTPADYVLESYGKLYLAYCAKEGMQPLNMVFPSSS